MNHTIEIYSTPNCHFCILAKEFFTKEELAYTEYDVARDVSKRREMIDKTNQMGVPVIVIDGNTTVGFHEPTIRTMLGM
jgi:glutaredoxin